LRWQGRRQSENVIERSAGGHSYGGRRSLRLLGGGGCGTVLVAGLLLLLGFSPIDVFNVLASSGVSESAPVTSSRAKNSTYQYRKDFVSVVLADTEEVWSEIFARRGKRYQEPHLVLFQDSVSSGCGLSSAAVGPFYCPPDLNLYIDLGFFDQLAGRLDAPGDFAQAYVIAHEVGHHVQNLLGTLDAVDREKRGLSKPEQNMLQVQVELQADYYAGVWAHHAQRRFQILEPGDLEEAVNAAGSIGDDTLQKKSQGYVVPDAFTHGTSKQRVRWFRKGFERGDLAGGDTFSIQDF
jgi:uncharacterized protein